MIITDHFIELPMRCDVLRMGMTASVAPKIRPIGQWAEEEVIIPTGPFEGRRFKVNRQPVIGHWFNAIDSKLWSEYAATGPSQSGKSLSCFVIPICYHLFEMQENVIVGLPDMDMAADKWELDILPVIERTRYREYLPKRGRGSHGGKVDTLRFLHGPVIKFMSGGGSDKSRAYFTSRVVCFTEVDGLAISQSTSVEADKVKQIEARTMAYGARRRIYKECTVSTKEGHIWKEYEAGTASRILLPCPHCREYVQMEREDLKGWEYAESIGEAKAQGSFVCRSCGHAWTDAEREYANHHSVIVNRGQVFDPKKRKVTGVTADVDVFGFRWSAANNLFQSASFLAAKEYEASKDPNEDNAAREMHQFIWCIPWETPGLDIEIVRPEQLIKRRRQWNRGVLPSETEYVTVGVDIGKYVGYWCMKAFLRDHTEHVVDYGTYDVPSDLGQDASVLAALRGLRDHFENGIPVADGSQRQPDQVWIDYPWGKRGVVAFLKDENTVQDVYRPIVGRGAFQQRRQWYNRPKSTGSRVKHLGEEFHFSWVPDEAVHLGEINADYWKSRVHEGFNKTPGQPGYCSLFATTHPKEHTSYAMHITAEHKEQAFVENKGYVDYWVRDRKANHWLDCTYIATAAGSFCGHTIVESQEPAAEPIEGGGTSLPTFGRNKWKK